MNGMRKISDKTKRKLISLIYGKGVLRQMQKANIGYYHKLSDMTLYEFREKLIDRIMKANKEETFLPKE